MSGNAKHRRELKAVARSNKKLENNNCWDELHELHLATATALLQHTGIVLLAKNAELKAFLPNKNQANELINSLARDLVILNTELTQIHAHHANKTGGAEDPDEVLLSINIYEHYQALMERHDAVVLPTSMQILEQFNMAEARRVAVVRQVMAQDASDTTPIDVEVKTVIVPDSELPQELGAGIQLAPSTASIH